MSVVHTAYIILFAGAALACLGGIPQTRRLASREVRLGLAGLLALSGLWALAIVVKLLVPWVVVKELTYLAGLVCGFGTVFAWLYFVSAYTGRRYHHDRKLVAAALAVFGLATLVKVTNPIHGAYLSAALVSDPFPHLAIDHSALHWLTMGVAYTLSAVGFWILYDQFRGQGTPVRLYLLVGVTALPAIPNFLATIYPGILLEVNYEALGVAVFAVGVLFFAQDSFLELSTSRHTHLVDVFSEGVVLLDGSGRVVSHNGQAVRAYPELARGEDDIEAIDADLAELAVGEERVLTRSVDGRARHYKVTRQPIESGPQFISMAITLTDVTQLVHLKEIRRVHSQVNEAIVEETTKQALKRRVCDELAAVESYRFVWYADADEDGLSPGYVAGDAEGYLDEVAFDPPTGDGDRDPVVQAIHDPDSYPGIVEIEAGEGTWRRRAAERNVSACMTLSLEPGDREASVIGVYTTARDGFSEPEQAMLADIRETLQHAVSAIETHEQARRYQEAVNRAGYALFITDVDGTIRYVNPAFEEITGYDAAEAIGRTPDLLTDEAEPGRVDVRDAVVSGLPQQGEVRNRRKNGERYWARRTISPVTNEDGDVTAVVAIEVDITDQRVREQRLTVLNRVLRHNLRNDMNVITGNASLMLDDCGPDRIGDHTPTEPARRIRDTADELMNLAEKAHRAERLIDSEERRGMTVDLGETLEEIQSTIDDEFPGKDVTVTPPETPSVEVDAGLGPALLELARNALEHGESDPNLHVEASVEHEQSGTDVKVVVADDGPGLPAQERSVLESGDESALKHGSGFGLWLVNWLVLQSGGTLSIDVDDGTTITLRVPVRDSGATRASHSPTPD
jgi:PAS domain S-box-containing protein